LLVGVVEPPGKELARCALLGGQGSLAIRISEGSGIVSAAGRVEQAETLEWWELQEQAQDCSAEVAGALLQNGLSAEFLANCRLPQYY
jgi:hypothetical protein